MATAVAPAAAQGLQTHPQASSQQHSLHASPAWQATLQSLLHLAGHALVPEGLLVTWLPYSSDPGYKQQLEDQGAQHGLQASITAAHNFTSPFVCAMSVQTKRHHSSGTSYTSVSFAFMQIHSCTLMSASACFPQSVCMKSLTLYTQPGQSRCI